VTSFLEFQRAKPIRILVIFWMTLAASTDLCIAGLLVWFLVRFHSPLCFDLGFKLNTFICSARAELASRRPMPYSTNWRYVSSTQVS
jgi:hypothetical protein